MYGGRVGNALPPHSPPEVFLGPKQHSDYWHFLISNGRQCHWRLSCSSRHRCNQLQQTRQTCVIFTLPHCICFPTSPSCSAGNHRKCCQQFREGILLTHPLTHPYRLTQAVINSLIMDVQLDGPDMQSRYLGTDIWYAAAKWLITIVNVLICCKESLYK